MEDSMAKALRILEYLLQDTQIDAVRFRGDKFTILFTPIRVNAGETYLHMDSGWRIKAKEHVSDGHTDNIAYLSPEEQMLALYSLRSKNVTSVVLIDSYPSLAIMFEDGMILNVDGYDEEYESWELGTAIVDPSDKFLLVAIPGGKIAILHPNNFM